MKPIIFLLLVLLSLSRQLHSQESRFRITREDKINDSLVKQTGELIIFNNTGRQFCIKVSVSFFSGLLSADTIDLAPLSIGDRSLYFNLSVSKDDAKMGLYDSPQYPLVLNNRTCFYATISLMRNVNCKNPWIEFSYFNDPTINYNELVKKFDTHQRWQSDPKIKYKSRKIFF